MNERFIWAIIRINAREEHFLDFLIPKFSWENRRTRENRGDSSENDNLKKSSIMWREHMFIYAACLRRNFNYCSILSLQLILIQDFIEKEWKDNGRDKCTGPGTPADIGRGKLYICAGRCEKPRRGLLQDASFQITWQPQWSPATTLIPMSWTHPGGVLY